MTILDTNVVSEALKPSPSRIVLEWLAAQETSEVFLTAITMAEVLAGVETLPAGKRKAKLASSIEKILTEYFQCPILPFDAQAARVYAKLVRSRNAIGRPISQFDAMIASVAFSHGAAVATRNTSDFEYCGIRVVNPWTA